MIARRSSGAGAQLDRLLGDRAHRVVGELDQPVELEELLVLLHERVLRLQ